MLKRRRRASFRLF